MQYRDFGKTGEKVSALGFGCMRFPTVEEDGKQVVDIDEAVRMVRKAIDSGVNYIDTAYGYHDGKSEHIVSKILADGYRDKVLLATKNPIWLLKTPEDFDRILNEQLERLNTDHVDFYLMHALSLSSWEKTVLPLGIREKMLAAKADGRIKHIGFSFHDNAEAFMTILNGFDEWEFCQIQMNYIDVDNQATLKGMEAASAKGLGVIIMEPLLGGKLAMPPVQVAKVLENSNRTPVDWSLNYLWSRPEVGVILSGMSTMEQVEENLRLADGAKVGGLNSDELATLDKARHVFLNMALVPCTKCAYCMPCPKGLDIPKIYEAYNLSASSGWKAAVEKYAELKVDAGECIGCKACEKVCPQYIASSELMPNISESFKVESAKL